MGCILDREVRSFKWFLFEERKKELDYKTRCATLLVLCKGRDDEFEETPVGRHDYF